VEADDGLAEAFWAVARRLRHLTRDTVEPWNVTPAQARALGVLARHGTMRLKDLSDHLRIAPRSATEVVDDIEQRGLVERRPDPDDRRATLVALTRAGTDAATAIGAARRAEAQRFFGTLSDADREHLARILRDLRD
jgi:DNA-binding MarR family transcriptional regulator